MNTAEFYQQLPTLATARLILRKLRMEDIRDYNAFASDPLVVQYLRWGPHASLEQTQAYITEVLEGYRKGTDGPWGIELAQEQRIIGSIHLMELDLYHRSAAVGVVLRSDYWGRGIGSEALRRVLALCFTELSLQRVQGLPIVCNMPACRMMEKCGMTREGRLRRYALQKGQWWDFEIYSILADEFLDFGS